jgi:hypothetical protein
MIFFREGHLRFSVFNHSDPDNPNVSPPSTSEKAKPPSRHEHTTRKASHENPREHGRKTAKKKSFNRKEEISVHLSIARRLLWHRKRRIVRGAAEAEEAEHRVGFAIPGCCATPSSPGGEEKKKGEEAGGVGEGRIGDDDTGSVLLRVGHPRNLLALRSDPKTKQTPKAKQTSKHSPKNSPGKQQQVQLVQQAQQELLAAEAAAAALGVGGTGMEVTNALGAEGGGGGTQGRAAGGKGEEEEEGEDGKKLPEYERKLARHITNPRFGMAHTRDTKDVIKPVTFLRDALLVEYGAAEAEVRWARYQSSMRNAVLMVMHAVRNRHWGNTKEWAYLFLAMDVASDRQQNAHVLDLNSGPSFYHGHEWPEWFVKERSSMIREAADIVQEVAFRKMVRAQRSPSTLSPSSLNDTVRPQTLYRDLHDVMSEPLTTLGGWDEIYREDFFGQPLPQQERLLKRNACATKHRDTATQGDSIKASVTARLTAVRQRLNAVINEYLRPYKRVSGDDAEDEEEDEVARTRAINDLEGALSSLLGIHEAAHAKRLNDTVDKAMTGHIYIYARVRV